MKESDLVNRILFQASNFDSTQRITKGELQSYSDKKKNYDSSNSKTPKLHKYLNCPQNTIPLKKNGYIQEFQLIRPDSKAYEDLLSSTINKQKSPIA